MRVLATLALIFASSEAIAIRETCAPVAMDTHFSPETVKGMSCHCFHQFANSSGLKEGVVAVINADPHKPMSEAVAEGAPGVPSEIRDAVVTKMGPCPFPEN